MGDRLTQLQDAVDQVRSIMSAFCFGKPALTRRQLAQQFVACLHFVHRRHDLETLGPSDRIRDIKQEPHQKEGSSRDSLGQAGAHQSLLVDPLPADEFQAGLKELSRDLIVKEQEIEYLISSLPGLENSEKDQERNIRDLEEDLKAAEAQRQDALREKDQILAELDTVIRSIRRP